MEQRIPEESHILRFFMVKILTHFFSTKPKKSEDAFPRSK